MFTQSIKKLLRRHAGLNIKLEPVAKTDTTQKVAFIHIAKCGGISIDNALRSALASPNDKRLCRQTSIAASLANFDGFTDSLAGCCDFSEHHLSQLQGILDYFSASNQHYISGHWAVNSQILATHSAERDFITVLRDPISRLKSNYIFNKLSNSLAVMPPSNLNTDHVIAEAKEIIFGRRGWQMANTQSAFITGRYAEDEDDAKTHQEAFANNLRQFKLVGFLDELTDFKDKFKLIYGEQLNIKQRNATSRLVNNKKQAMLDELHQFFDDKKTKQHLSNICKTEMDNYLRAKERHFEQ